MLLLEKDATNYQQCTIKVKTFTDLNISITWYKPTYILSSKVNRPSKYKMSCGYYPKIKKPNCQGIHTANYHKFYAFTNVLNCLICVVADWTGSFLWRFDVCLVSTTWLCSQVDDAFYSLHCVCCYILEKSEKDLVTDE